MQDMQVEASPGSGRGPGGRGGDAGQDAWGLYNQHRDQTLLPVAPSSSRKTMESAKVASFTYGSAHKHHANCQNGTSLPKP